ncbi:MAG: molybdate ABC transporter substrate-binding protein [Pseudolabrys sp.]|nr:molybdate ABC transporter substrate-binding protein [Pseudolabrys sp.]
MREVRLYAAGSLKAALGAVAKAYEVAGGGTIVPTFGASGLLKDEIVSGAKADAFASANMEHPQALHDAGLSGDVILFARNTLCALVRPGLQIDPESLLARMLDANVKVGTSTPKADPSGDYAFAVFARAEAVKHGACAALKAKALKLTGAKDSATAPPGQSVYAWHVLEGRADIFITYRTNALAAQKENPALHIVDLPPALAVGADYGLTVLNGASEAARAFAQFILAREGQGILTSHGFTSAK